MGTVREGPWSGRAGGVQDAMGTPWECSSGGAWAVERFRFAGQDPPAALLRYSRNRSGAHAVEHLRGFTGILQADAYAGYNPFYTPGRVPGPVTEALCWAHGRRKFYELADIAASKRRGKGRGADRSAGAGGGETH